MALSPAKVSFFLLPSSKVSIFPSSSSVSFSEARGRRRGLMVKALSSSLMSSGVIFEPFEEIKKEVLAVPMAPQVSMARQNYEDECEAAINEQINVEYNVSYVYHSMFAYFDRDNIALKGLAK